MALFFIFPQVNEYEKNFDVQSYQIQPGDVFNFWVYPMWRQYNVCVSFAGKNYKPDKNGWVWVGMPVDMSPGRYLSFLIDCDRNSELNKYYQYLEVLEREFPERKLKRRIVRSTSHRRAKEEIEIINAYNKANIFEYFRKDDFVNPLTDIFVTNEFGKKTIYVDGSVYHKGVDLRARRGTPIKAINSGVVLLAKKLSLEGNMVMIDHGSGIVSVYLHLSKIKVKKDQKVENGQVIGLSGNTGSTSGPHLHLIIRARDVYVDPLPAIESLNRIN